jgi:hypothetical protein
LDGEKEKEDTVENKEKLEKRLKMINSSIHQ